MRWYRPWPALLGAALCVHLAACQCDSDPPVVGVDAGPGDAGVDAGHDAGTARDAGMRIDSGTLFQRLYAGNDAVLPGSFCSPSDDRCRGSALLFVCMDESRDPAGAGALCVECESDTECRFEYPYFGDLITCDGAGHCVLPTGTGCSVGLGVCITARAGSFVCADGACDRCIGDRECTDEYGEGQVCATDLGSCVEAGSRTDAGPPDGGVAGDGGAVLDGGSATDGG